jgi:hypothetical protein
MAALSAIITNNGTIIGGNGGQNSRWQVMTGLVL